VVRTDGELAAAIVDPSQAVTLASPAGEQSGRLSRMGDFSEAMTVRQLVEIVAFLHAHTQVERQVASH
jgi:hypothetical protein